MKNKTKNILDLLIIVMLILDIVLTRITNNVFIMFIPIVIVCIISIIDAKIWECPNCKKHLPSNKAWTSNVICCPYCGKIID